MRVLSLHIFTCCISRISKLMRHFVYMNTSIKSEHYSQNGHFVLDKNLLCPKVTMPHQSITILKLRESPTSPTKIVKAKW